MTMTIGGHDVHPAAELFPLLEGAAFDALVEDINQFGLRQAVVLIQVPDPLDEDEMVDLVLDGRNRYRACVQNGVRPHFEYYRADDPVDYVVSTNLRRRHLDESQRAMVAAKVAKLGHGGDRITKQAARVRLATPTQAQAAEMLNVSERSVQHAAKVQREGTAELAAAVDEGKVTVKAAATLVGLPAEEQRRVPQMSRREILEAAKKINRDRRDERRAERVQNIARIESQNRPIDGSLGLHSVHYWDPPWKYDAGTTDVTREIENKYPPMELADICALPVATLCTPDAILYMWTTAPKFEEACAVVRAWGFNYRTNIIWHKTLADGETGKMGMGYWARVEHEHLIIATRGSFPTPDPALLERSVMPAPLGEHSAKPHCFAEMIERLYPSLSKLEGFCRSPRQGWTVWGNQSADELAL